MQKWKEKKKDLFCNTCYTRRDNLCFQQAEKTCIKSYKTGKSYKIFDQLILLKPSRNLLISMKNLLHAIYWQK